MSDVISFHVQCQIEFGQSRDGCDGIIVEFSDGTTGAFVVQELAGTKAEEGTEETASEIGFGSTTLRS